MFMVLLLLIAMFPTATLLAQQPAVWRVSTQPILRIGEADGDSAYMFHNAVSSLRLADGRIVVLNSGSNQLRIYDAKGKLVFSKGRRGNGPGEFVRAIRLYSVARDTLVVYDRGNSRFTVHTLAGDFVRSYPVLEQRNKFTYDEWLYNRSWIDGPQLGRGRGPIRVAIDKLPPHDPAIGYRFVRVSPQGHLWVLGPHRPNAPTNWSVYDLDGRPLARVTTPARFDLHEIGRDYLLGVGRDDLDVEYIQLYRLEGAAAAPTRRLAGPDTTSVPARKAVAEEVLTTLRGTLRMLMSHQEVYYSNPKSNYSYALDLKQLDKWETPKGVTLYIVTAGTTGWSALVTDNATGAMCGTSVGTHTPVGWTSGIVACE
jgi:hypothetical protein